MIPMILDMKWENSVKEEEEFYNFRKEYQIVYQNLFGLKMLTGFMISSIGQRLVKIQNEMSSIKHQEVELPLFLMTTLHQARKDQNETNLLRNVFFKALEIDFIRFDSEVILLQYHELINKYIQFYLTEEHLLKVIMNIYLGEKGIMHPNTKIGAKLCGVFIKFIEKAKMNLGFIAADAVLQIKNVLDRLIDFKNFGVRIKSKLVFDRVFSIISSFRIVGNAKIF